MRLDALPDYLRIRVLAAQFELVRAQARMIAVNDEAIRYAEKKIFSTPPKGET